MTEENESTQEKAAIIENVYNYDFCRYIGNSL